MIILPVSLHSRQNPNLFTCTVLKDYINIRTRERNEIGDATNLTAKLTFFFLKLLTVCTTFEGINDQTLSLEQSTLFHKWNVRFILVNRFFRTVHKGTDSKSDSLCLTFNRDIYLHNAVFQFRYKNQFRLKDTNILYNQTAYCFNKK